MEVNQVVSLGDIQFMVKAFEETAYADLPDVDFIGVDLAECP